MQLLLGFSVIQIERNAIHGAYFFALGRIEMADAFGAFCGIDFVDFNAHVDRFVRALGLADVAVNALIGNFERHILELLSNLPFERRTDGGMHKIAYVAA